MTKKKGGSAFPHDRPAMSGSFGTGMTLRDYFAAKAMDRLIARAERQMSANVADGTSMDDWECYYEYIAEQSYLIADAMLEERDK